LPIFGLVRSLPLHVATDTAFFTDTTNTIESSRSFWFIKFAPANHLFAEHDNYPECSQSLPHQSVIQDFTDLTDLATDLPPPLNPPLYAHLRPRRS
jgi:hypothetical protein